jgi:hypothetical protein
LAYYGGASTPPTPNSFIILGPDLLKAYESLGNKAAQIAKALDAAQVPAFQGLETAAVVSMTAINGGSVIYK